MIETRKLGLAKFKEAHPYKLYHRVGVLSRCSKLWKIFLLGMTFLSSLVKLIQGLLSKSFIDHEILNSVG